MLPLRIRILADDMTGAADAAAPHARRDAPATLCLKGKGDLSARVLSVDGAYRDSPADLHRSAIAGFFGQRDPREASELWYLKVDSILRGDIPGYLSCLPKTGGAPRLVVLAPAFPVQGRTLADGRARGADGQALSPDIRDGLRAAGWTVSTLTVTARSGRSVVHELGAIAATRRDDTVILAETDDDAAMAVLARAILDMPGDLFAAGSAGLSEAVAALTNGTPAEAPTLRQPFVAVVGSQAGAVRRQLSRLETEANAVRISRALHQWADPTDLAPAIRKALADAWEQARPAIFDLAHDADAATQGGAAPCLAVALAPHINALGALFLSGGDTARAMFDALGIDRLAVLGSAVPGTSVLQSDRLGFPVLVKSGGFSDDELLLRLFEATRDTFAETRP